MPMSAWVCLLQISNYAKPGHRSRHNQVYWNCQPYYAFGLGAASYARGRRFTRPRVMKDYEEWVQGYVASGAGCPATQLPPESQVGLVNCILGAPCSLWRGLVEAGCCAAHVICAALSVCCLAGMMRTWLMPDSVLCTLLHRVACL